MSDTQTTTVPTVAEIVEQLSADLTDNVTPYKIATVVNGAFKVLEFAKEIKPQMMYNYARNGLIVKGVKDRNRFTKAEAVDFVTRYVTRTIS